MARHGRLAAWQCRGYSRHAVRFLEPTLLLILHHGSAHGYTMMEKMGGFGWTGLEVEFHPITLDRFKGLLQGALMRAPVVSASSNASARVTGA